MPKFFTAIWYEDESESTDWRIAYLSDTQDQVIEAVLKEIEGLPLDTTHTGTVFSCEITNDIQEKSLIAYSESMNMEFNDLTGKALEGFKHSDQYTQHHIDGLRMGIKTKLSMHKFN